MEFGVLYDTFQVARFPSDSWGIVVKINIEPRRPENWRQRANESVNDPEANQFAAVFNEAIVVGREHMGPLARGSPADQG
jgi:hypothetical protein